MIRRGDCSSASIFGFFINSSLLRLLYTDRRKKAGKFGLQGIICPAKDGEIEVAGHALFAFGPGIDPSERGRTIWADLARRISLPAKPKTNPRKRLRCRSRTMTSRTATWPRRSAIATVTMTSRYEALSGNLARENLCAR